MTTVVAGSANPRLARAVAEELAERLTPADLTRHPDGEAAVAVDPGVRDQDVYLIQSLAPPVDAHLMELALLADANRRAGCARLTAVVPYVCYARQDRRTREGEAVGARVVADLLEAVGVDRVLAVDPHTAQLEAMFSVPLDAVSAVNLLADGLGDLPAEAVVVAPDLGAVKLAERYATRLGLPAAFVGKTRLSGRHVEARNLVGQVRDRVPVIVDDMVSTGSTIEAAVEALVEHGCAQPVRVVATHGLFVDGADDILRTLPLDAVDVSDTVPQEPDRPFPLRVRSAAPLLAAAITCLAGERPLGELAAHG